MKTDTAVRGLGSDTVRPDALPKQRVIALGLGHLQSGVRLSPQDDVDRAIHLDITIDLYRGLSVADQREVRTALLNRAFVMLHGESWNHQNEDGPLEPLLRSGGA